MNEPNSPYTPTLPQTVGAQLDQQPTPSSVARAQQQANARYNEVLDQARALDAQNNSDCEKVVRELKNLVGMQ